jgi:hypothetical protein
VGVTHDDDSFILVYNFLFYGLDAEEFTQLAKIVILLLYRGENEQ